MSNRSMTEMGGAGLQMSPVYEKLGALSSYLSSLESKTAEFCGRLKNVSIPRPENPMKGNMVTEGRALGSHLENEIDDITRRVTALLSLVETANTELRL